MLKREPTFEQFRYKYAGITEHTVQRLRPTSQLIGPVSRQRLCNTTSELETECSCKFSGICHLSLSEAETSSSPCAAVYFGEALGQGQVITSFEEWEVANVTT